MREGVDRIIKIEMRRTRPFGRLVNDLNTDFILVYVGFIPGEDDHSNYPKYVQGNSCTWKTLTHWKTNESLRGEKGETRTKRRSNTSNLFTDLSGKSLGKKDLLVLNHWFRSV